MTMNLQAIKEAPMTIYVFVQILNSYKGENIWQDLIYGAAIDGDEIDFDRCAEGTGDVIYLASGETILYYPHSKEWA